MGQIAMALPPTRIWQQFEELTRDVADIVFNDKGAHNYGNPGSAQNGVDVYCHENGNGRLIGIQCKRSGKKDANGNRLAGGLKRTHIEAEVKKAEKFSEPLEHFILATTDSRQTELQDYALRINADRKANGKFTFDLWFWDDYLSYLHKYSNLLQWYYDNVLKLTGVYSYEHQILYLFQMAFSRPAFTRRLLSEEDGTGLSDALRDTETALNTGQLKDRKTRGLFRAAPGGIGLIGNPSWSKLLGDALVCVQNARAKYKEAKDADLLIELSDRIEVRDYQVARDLDDIRGKAIKVLNNVLRDAGLQEVESPLA